MKKFLRVFLFSLMLVAGLIFVSCGKKELTGLHKEFDIIFNGIKEEVTTENKSNLLNEIEGLLKKIKKGKAPVIEQEMDIEMTKENDTWTIPERQKYVLMKRMMGIPKGSIFDN